MSILGGVLQIRLATLSHLSRTVQALGRVLSSEVSYMYFHITDYCNIHFVINQCPNSKAQGEKLANAL